MEIESILDRNPHGLVGSLVIGIFGRFVHARLR
jgi:hypothetical protein